MADPADRVNIINLRSGDVFSAQFNPQELERMVSVNYAQQGIMGMSHQQLQFQYRNNETLKFTFYFDSRSTDAGDLVTAERMLDATTLGSRAAQTISGGGPPDVIFQWGDYFHLRCRVQKLKYNYKRFTLRGQPIYFSCEVDVTEIRDERLYAEDVMANGLVRG